MKDESLKIGDCGSVERLFKINDSILTIKVSDMVGSRTFQSSRTVNCYQKRTRNSQSVEHIVLR